MKPKHVNKISAEDANGPTQSHKKQDGKAMAARSSGLANYFCG